MELTIATWNCCQGTDRKLPVFLKEFRPDIAVIPESSSNPAVATAGLFSEAMPHLWTGSWPNKGLGIFSRPGASLEPRDVPDGPGSHSLAADVHLEGRTFSVLGIWAVPLKGTGLPTAYMGAFSEIMDRHADLLAAGQTIVAGDINCSGQSSPDSFPEFFGELLDRHGLVSAYHSHTGHAVGEEGHCTLFWRRKRADPFHCDVILVPKAWRIKEVTVGDYDGWCADDAPARSDHVPVVTRVEAGKE